MTLQEPFFRLRLAVVLAACVAAAACTSQKELSREKSADPAGSLQPQSQTPPQPQSQTPPQTQSQPQPQVQPPVQPQHSTQPAESPPQPQTQTQTQTQATGPQLYAAHPDAMAYADELAGRHQLDPEWVRQAIGQARFHPTVARLMQPLHRPDPDPGRPALLAH